MMDATLIHRHVIPAAASAAATILVGIAAVRWPELGEKSIAAAERSFSRFAKRKALAVCAIFLFVVAGRLLVLPLLPVPVPGTHDEFSYLLMADTFAHGRLANPTHPMWISFETFHVNWVPTYSSMYPPGQGFVLAVGQLLGNPWIGVLLSDAAMCAAVLWMLQAWFPARWAFLGAALAAIRLGFASYWMNSYWGGAVAGAGGALVLGGVARVTRRVTVRDALLLGLGLFLLANSRPYEGLIFSLPSVIFLLLWAAGRRRAGDRVRDRIVRGVLPLAAVLMVTLAFVGFYNWRLTGSALLFPHRLNMQTYHTTGLFVWQRSKPPLEYRNQQFEDYYNGWAREEYDRSLRSLWKITERKIVRYGSTFCWFGACFALLGFPRAVRDRRIRLLVITLAVGSVAVFSTIWSNPHYAAPLTCAIFGLIVQSMRHLRLIRFRGAPVGRALSRAVVLLLVLDTASNVGRRACDPLLWPCQGDASRVFIENKLKQIPGKHLLLVRYSEDHNVHDEWVYNGADIDGAPVVWAREIDPEQTVKLCAYFKDRDVWLVEPDIDNTELLPYPLEQPTKVLDRPTGGARR